MRIFSRRTGRPARVAVAPVVEDHMSGRIGDAFRHDVQELVVRIKRHLTWCPVKAVFMKVLVWSEREMWSSEARRVDGIEASCLRFWRLKDEVDVAAVRFIELLGQKLHVDLLGVVVVLPMSTLLANSLRNTHPEHSTTSSVRRPHFCPHSEAAVQHVRSVRANFSGINNLINGLAHPELHAFFGQDNIL